jgi:Fe-S-cluster containining protein
MNTEEKFNFKCVHCGNCCTDPSTIVNLSYSDLLRIQKGLDINLNELLEIVGFYIFTTKLDDSTRKKLVTPPLKTEKGFSYIGLLKEKNGQCIFYDNRDNRCKIYSLRPNFCRTFPFTFQYNQNSDELKILITDKGKDFCLGLTQDAPPIDKTYWLKLGERVLMDLKKNYRFIEQWNSLVKNKKVKASAKGFLQKLLKLDEDKEN